MAQERGASRRRAGSRAPTTKRRRCRVRFRLENLWAARPSGIVQDALTIEAARIAASSDASRAIDLEGALVLPAFINAHDHLELNGLPRTGRRAAYRNVREWFQDVWDGGSDPEFKAWLAEPLARRLGFSAFLNLLNGCLTVAHHNPYYWRHFLWRFPVDVLRTGWCHSLAIESDPVRSLARTPADSPFVLHFAEGTDAEARGELSRLKHLGLLTSRTVLVHAVGLSVEKMREVADAGAGIVWCPGSNLFLFGSTLSARAALAAGVPVALGSDSTLSGEGGLLREIALARETTGLTGVDLLKLVAEIPARLLHCPDRGSLEPGERADLVVAEAEARSFCPARLTPESIALVVRGGRPLLAAPRFQRVFDALGVRFVPVRFGSMERLLDARYAPRYHAVFGRDDKAHRALARVLSA